MASYTYDDNGIRTSKTYGDTTTYYTNVDGAITSQYCLDGDGAVTDLMQFIYDGSNDLLGFTYNGATYFYVKNLQGDVIAVIDSAGAEKAVYEYGAYGTLIYSGGDLADVNPMRYRGYYYDSDFGGYYLQSRYYAPEFAKFINSDLPEYAQVQKADHYGTNLFAYCCNDPVNNSDPTGNAKNNKLVGWGIQIDLSIGFTICSGTVGIELIWFKDKYHKGNKYAPYLFLYTSIGLGVSSKSNNSLYNKAKDFARKKFKSIANKKPKNVKALRKIFSFSISVSIFVIRGFKKTEDKYTKFSSANSYKGPFSTASATVFGFKGYVAVGPTCFVVGIGVDSNKFSVNYSNCNYYLLNKPESDLKKLLRYIKKRV
ncbi:MAG: RHS repeat-associated core domain-containing protein [Eubacteriales bacterium]|nr:RHS repeat-associated core domain-containing protein [Eubacteriales bacterium]